MNRTVVTGLLLSSLVFTAAAYASSPSDDAPASTPRISTGVTPPEILNSLNLETNFVSEYAAPLGSLVTVSFTVDEAGHPRDIQILKGIDPYWNARIAAAILNLRYRPATLNNQPISMAVKMNVDIE